MIFNKIRIMLGGEPDGDENPPEDQQYDSYAKDLSASGNKSRPQLDDHNLIYKMVKLLRGDDDPKALPASPADDGPQRPVESGIIDQIRRKLFE